MKVSTALVASAGVRPCLGGLVRSRDAPSNDSIQTLEPRHFGDAGAKRVKISYEAMTVPGMGDATTHGMKSFLAFDPPMPCRGCLVTEFVPGLEFSDGASANIRDGLSLHHTVFLNINRTDASCADWPDRFMAAGNERTAVDLTLNGTRKAGYYLGDGDTAVIVTELMNESDKAQTVKLTAEWEFIDGTPDGFDLAVPVWLDVTGTCGDSELPVPGDEKIFNATMSPAWSPPFSGDLATAGSHLHDGGIRQELYRDGKVICDSTAGYGETDAYIDPMMMGPMAMEGSHVQEADGVKRISSMATCENLGTVGPDNKLTVTAYYNLTEHPGMSNNDGGLAPVMGIALLHVVRDRDEALQAIHDTPPPDIPGLLGRINLWKGLEGISI